MKNILFSKITKSARKIEENNEYALNEVRSLKSFYPDCMIWFKPVCGHFIFLVIDPKCREIVEVLDTVSEGSTPLSDDEFHEYISELSDMINIENEDEIKFDRNYSIERFLEENLELANQVSLDIHLEDERFYDSNFFD